MPLPQQPTFAQLLDAELAEIAAGKTTACAEVSASDPTLTCMRIVNHQAVGNMSRESHAKKVDPNDDTTWVTWVD